MLTSSQILEEEAEQDGGRVGGSDKKAAVGAMKEVEEEQGQGEDVDGAAGTAADTVTTNADISRAGIQAGDDDDDDRLVDASKSGGNIYSLVNARFVDLSSALLISLERDKSFRMVVHSERTFGVETIDGVDYVILIFSFTSDAVIVVKCKKNGHKFSLTSFTAILHNLLLMRNSIHYAAYLLGATNYDDKYPWSLEQYRNMASAFHALHGTTACIDGLNFVIHTEIGSALHLNDMGLNMNLSDKMSWDKQQVCQFRLSKAYFFSILAATIEHLQSAGAIDLRSRLLEVMMNRQSIAKTVSNGIDRLSPAFFIIATHMFPSTLSLEADEEMGMDDGAASGSKKEVAADSLFALPIIPVDADKKFHLTEEADDEPKVPAEYMPPEELHTMTGLITQFLDAFATAICLATEQVTKRQGILDKWQAMVGMACGKTTFSFMAWDQETDRAKIGATATQVMKLFMSHSCETILQTEQLQLENDSFPKTAWLDLAEVLQEIVCLSSYRSLLKFQKNSARLQFCLMLYGNMFSLVGPEFFKPHTINAVFILTSEINRALAKTMTLFNATSARVNEMLHAELKKFARTPSGNKLSPANTTMNCVGSMKSILQSRALSQARVASKGNFARLSNKSLVLHRKAEAFADKLVEDAKLAALKRLNRQLSEKDADGDTFDLKAEQERYNTLISRGDLNLPAAFGAAPERNKEDLPPLDTLPAILLRAAAFDEVRTSGHFPIVSISVLTKGTGGRQPYIAFNDDFQLDNFDEIKSASVSIYSTLNLPDVMESGGLRLQFTATEAGKTTQYVFIWAFSSIASIHHAESLLIKNDDYELGHYVFKMTGKPIVATSQVLEKVAGRRCKTIAGKLINLYAGGNAQLLIAGAACNILKDGVEEEGVEGVAEGAQRAAWGSLSLTYKRTSKMAIWLRRLVQLLQTTPSIAPAHPLLPKLCTTTFLAEKLDKALAKKEALHAHIQELRTSDWSAKHDAQQRTFPQDVNNMQVSDEGGAEIEDIRATLVKLARNPMKRREPVAAVKEKGAEEESEEEVEVSAPFDRPRFDVVCSLKDTAFLAWEHATQEEQRRLFSFCCLRCGREVYITSAAGFVGCTINGRCAVVSAQELLEENRNKKKLPHADSLTSDDGGEKSPLAKYPLARKLFPMVQCSRCLKYRRYLPELQETFTADDSDFYCQLNSWDEYKTCDVNLEDGCEDDAPTEVAYDQKVQDDYDGYMAAVQLRTTASAGNKRRGEGDPVSP